MMADKETLRAQKKKLSLAQCSNETVKKPKETKVSKKPTKLPKMPKSPKVPKVPKTPRKPKTSLKNLKTPKTPKAPKKEKAPKKQKKTAKPRNLFLEQVNAFDPTLKPSEQTAEKKLDAYLDSLPPDSDEK